MKKETHHHYHIFGSGEQKHFTIINQATMGHRKKINCEQFFLNKKNVQVEGLGRLSIRTLI